MCDYCGSEYVPVCECGREYVNTPDELATLRAENTALKGKMEEIASDDWNNQDWVHEFAKEALK